MVGRSQLSIKNWRLEKIPSITLNVLYTKEMEIFSAYISKISSNFEKQIFFLMIPNKEKEGWHCPAVKKLLALLRGIMSKQLLL